MNTIAIRLRQERGQILMLVALLATAMLGLVGLVVDTGLAYAERRQAQNAADNAALAGTRILFEGGSTSDAIAAAFEYADENGFDNSSGSSTVTVNIPPASGEHVSDPDYVEVIVSEEPTTFFIHVLIPGGSTVQARGVAGFPFFPEPYALVVLAEHDCQAFRQQGNASMTIVGGGVMINSDCEPDALSKTGAGDLIVDGSIDVYGGYEQGGSGTVSPEPNSVSWTVSDPLASLPPPPLGSPAPGSTGTAENPETWTVTSGGDFTLSPGTYYGGFYSNCTCTITLEPGVYVMAGGGFTKGGGASFVGDRVTIYVTENPTNPTGDGEPEPFDLTGSGALDLSPPTSGLYEGITLWQDIAITEDFKMRGSNDLISGIIYAPGATLDISGDSQFGTVQLVVNGFLLSGNSPLDLTYGEFRTFEAPKVVLVE
ncbi:MAG: hypothetical protein IIA23_09145 [Chloroflexi bacterium]|nr:hypothetical protein [Chloroflexota bacterium]